MHDTDDICLDWVRGIAQAHASLLLPDLNTHAHQVMITQLAIPFALHLGYSAHEAQIISVGCQVHDIGKTALLPELQANKNVLLERSSKIFARMKLHTEYGERFFNALIQCVGYEHLLLQFAEICKFHHEQWDGHGYYGLVGQAIPKSARLIGILDAFTAMTEPLRAYRVALTQEQAVAELRSCAGTQFDPSMISVLLAIMQNHAVCSTPRPG